MSLQDTEYSDLECQQQQNDNLDTTEGATTMKALSNELTDQYPAITHRKQLVCACPFYCIPNTATVISGRPKAEKWETTMAAIAQIIAVLKPGEIGNPNALVFPAVQNQCGGRTREAANMAVFDTDASKFLTSEVIEDLRHVWYIWMETIRHASAIGAQVYEKRFYGPPHSIPWIEFIGIAVVMTKHYQIYGYDDSADAYPIKLVLADVSRLRRWLRCNLKSDGFRRSDADWAVCWDIINETPGDEKQIPRVSAFKTEKNGTKLFRFQDEPELSIDAEQDPASEVEDEEREDEAMTGTTEHELEEELHPKLRGAVTGPVKVEPEDLLGGAASSKRAKHEHTAWGDTWKYYPIDNTREFF